MDPATAGTSCSCSIVRAAFVVLFKDVFDVSLDLAGHKSKEAHGAEGMYVCSLRCESNIIAASASDLPSRRRARFLPLALFDVSTCSIIFFLHHLYM